MSTETHKLAVEASAALTLPLVHIVSSPTNPRKAYDKAGLEELAASIRTQGVIQPVIVRPWPTSRKPPKEFAEAAETGFELVVGERRLRAAKLAGLEVIPAVVREMTDAEVLERQITENLQRADLHPLEEAEGYRQLLTKNYNVARIAEQTGHSVRYVYDRVKLLSLTKAAQQEFLEGRIAIGHAIELARLRPADQNRAMDVDTGGLWQDEHTLFEPDAEDTGDYRESYKTRSARELKAWIDEHVKLEAADIDPMLFPETALALKAAAEESAKVVRITHEVMTPEEVKEGPRPILGRSWKRADGQRGSKTCEHSRLGEVVIGPGRGQAFRVCADKKHCTVHWGDLIKAAKKREKEVTKAGATGEDREAIRRRKQEEEQARQKAERERWDKAQPVILAALAAAVKKASAGAGSALGKLVLEVFADYVYGNQHGAPEPVPAGKTAEDLVRHLGFRLLARDFEDMREEEFAEEAKALGVDVKKILAAAAPVPKCRKCGCTEDKACKGGCGWTQMPDPKTGLGLCSGCAVEHALRPKATGKAGKKSR